MQLRQLIYVAALCAIGAGAAFSQCGPSTSDSDVGSDNEFIADTGGQSDTGMQGADTSSPSDTSSQPNDTIQDGDTTGSDGGSMDGAGTDGSSTPQFNPDSTDSISGKITSIDTLAQNGNNELQLTLVSPDQNTIIAQLAPESFLKDLNFSVKEGDSVTVVGFKTTKNQKPKTIVASKVVKDKATYLLRDESGKPFWPENKNSQGAQ